jgi:hypothetical protein
MKYFSLMIIRNLNYQVWIMHEIKKVAINNSKKVSPI